MIKGADRTGYECFLQGYEQCNASHCSKTSPCAFRERCFGVHAALRVEPMRLKTQAHQEMQQEGVQASSILEERAIHKGASETSPDPGLLFEV